VFGNALGDAAYGLVCGATSSGHGYLQAQRTDGTATTFDLFLQPNGGNVGIGTTSPNAKFVVYRPTVNASNPVLEVRSNHDTTDSVKFSIDGDGEAFFSDRVGIGTTSPDTLLHLSGADTAVLRLENTDTSLGSSQLIGAIEFEKQDPTGAGVGIAGAIRLKSMSSVGQAASMFFATSNSSGNDQDRMTIDFDGRVLIGGATASHGSSNADDLQIGANNQSNQTGITLGSASGSSIRFADAGDDTAGAINYIHGDNTMRFSAASSERVRIDSDGIKFNGDSSGNNGLNDYEQGTWTATAEFNTGGFKSCANNVCRYVKIGNLVHVSGRFSLNNHTGATSGELRIEGLPFSKGNPSGDGNSDGICIYVEGAKTTISTGISGLVLDSTTQFLIRQSGTTASGNDMTGKTDTGTTLLIGGTYSTFG